MAGEEGDYCTICGGMVPKGGDVRKISVDGKVIGISGLDEILRQVASLGISRPEDVKAALLAAVQAANYVPSKKAEAYGDALYDEYLRYAGSGE